MQRLRLPDDRGSASAQVVIMLPVTFLAFFMVVQFAMWSHATHIAQAAASQGLAAVRVHGGSPADGAASARNVLADLGGGPLRDTNVDCERGSETALVRISGTAKQVVPFLSLPVHAKAAGPVERFVEPRR
ncbi:TadE/TadG family type IV pilus assembly protein [Lentzea sp. NEAU-D7]|uniref:TadE/TadG family type IV pilus assembly protein n=1 Tax=Lentzea sp. NEAU-D7 TaxID=2994667 RepID=UPI00224ADD7D|nr:TadE family protein [Lentzea sp. NEAU-D7]MCX2948977.1 pilus assembly protein [Lentzea sp. NEAU-D7]